MTYRNRLTIARILVLTLMFRVGLGFGHGPMVTPPPDLMLQGFCGQLSESGKPDGLYQGCPICHALSYQADVEDALISVPPESVLTPILTAKPISWAQTPRIQRREFVHPPRPPPITG